jgi:hypothetical protein
VPATFRWSFVDALDAPRYCFFPDSSLFPGFSGVQCNQVFLDSWVALLLALFPFFSVLGFGGFPGWSHHGVTHALIGVLRFCPREILNQTEGKKLIFWLGNSLY